MKKNRRILKSEEFQKIMKKKQFFSCPSLVIYYALRQENVSRVGLTVSKKVGNAVYRNKCKRQLRMILSKLIEKDDQYDYIVLARIDYFKFSYEENKKSLENLYKKIKIKKIKENCNEKTY